MLAGSIANAKLTNSSVTVTAGSGLSGGGAVSLGGSVTLAHASVAAGTSVDNAGGNVVQDITVDSFGHVTAIGSTNLDSRYLQSESDTLATVTGRGSTTGATITAGGFTTTGTVSTGVLTTTGNATVGGTLTVTGDLTVSGSVTTINTEQINLADNIILLNSNFVGTNPTENAGISVNRSTAPGGNKTLEWNETTDKWSFGSETVVAATFEGALSGNATTATSAGKLTTARTINGVSFDGTTNITIPSGTAAALSAGSGLKFANVGETFDGTAARTLSVDTTAIASVSGSQAITNKTYNGLSLTALTTGFSAAGGTTSKTLTVSNTLTLAGTDGSTLNVGAGGTLGSAAFTASSAYVAPNTAVQLTSLGVGTAASGTTGEIRATNNVTAYYSSDERLKTNIEKIDGALEKISQIDGVIYDWNETYLKDHGSVDGYFVRSRNSGVIAQQVEKVFPNVVADRADGYKAVRYELLVPLLIEAIKELKQEIAELKK
jgi:hypothetical protein